MNSALPNFCPCCNQNLIITQLHCGQCGTILSGTFISLFNQLSEDDLLFIKNFVLNSGSLKHLSKQIDKSYPTVRKMLNQIIKKME